MKRFEDKVVLVTGGSSGIGREAALAFAKEGAKVVITANKNINGAMDTLHEINKLGGQGCFIQSDVSKEEDVRRLFSEIMKRYGRLDCAFNNAGIGPDGVRVPFTLIEECSESIWDQIIDTNLKGTFLCMKYEIQMMKSSRRGSIVNNASVGALKPIAGFGPYAASKAGVILLTKTAAIECASYNIRVNAICPGFTLGTLLSENVSKSDPVKTEEMLKFIPLKRGGEPKEIVNAVLWLCSDEASFVTGIVMPIDGGLSAT
ncbi:MAG: glucose 1-dehydrogenase [Candidatus Bathyarchaeia archaeon]